MGAVISGKCKQCGIDYHYNIGRTKWHDDHVLHNKTNPIYDSFEALRKKGLCQKCGRSDYARFASAWKNNSTKKFKFGEGGNSNAKNPGNKGSVRSKA